MPLTNNSDSLVTRNLSVEDLLRLGDDTVLEFQEMATPATPAAGSLVAYAKADGKLYIKNDAGTELDLTAGAAGGEANTASNQGAGGVGVFKQKTGVDLEFKSVNAGSSRVSVTDDVGNNEVDIDVVEANLTHDNIGGTLGIAKGGTGQTSKTPAFNALAPTATKGDVIAHNGTNNVGLAVGSDGQVLKANSAMATGLEWAAEGAGSGEANTASNVGTGGVGVFKQKSALDLEFKRINAGSAKITVSDDVANDEVDVDLGSVALADLSDVTAKSGTGSTVVMQGSPTLTTPAIGDFSNAGHNHQNAAGGGTLDAAAIAAGTLNGARLAAKNKTVAKIIYIENPTASDSFPLGYVPDAATLVAVRAVTDTGTANFNIEKRGKLTPGSAGTDVWSVDQQATSSGLEQTSFDSGSISADSWLQLAASAVAGSPTRLWVSVEYVID